MVHKIVGEQRRKALYSKWAKGYLNGEYTSRSSLLSRLGQGICWRMAEVLDPDSTKDSNWGPLVTTAFPEANMMAMDDEYWWMTEDDDKLRATILLFCYHMI